MDSTWRQLGLLHSNFIIKANRRQSSLAQVFKKMATDVYERTGMLKSQVNQLIIKIDELRRKQQVSEVVESEFFTDLQRRAREIRSKDKGENGEAKAATD